VTVARNSNLKVSGSETGYIMQQCAGMVEVAQKTGKLQGYRLQSKYNFIKFLRNSSPTSPPPSPLLHYHPLSPPPPPLVTMMMMTTATKQQNKTTTTTESVSQSVPSYFESPGSIPAQSKRDLWGVKGHWNVFSPGS